MEKLHLRTLSVGGLASLAAAVAVYFGLSFGPARQARAGFERHARALAEVLATTVQPSVTFDDKDALARDIKVVQVDPTVAGAVVRTATGAVMAGFAVDAVPDAADLRQRVVTAADRGEVHLVSVPLPVGGKVEHWLVMAASLASLRETLESSRQAAFLVALLVGLGGVVAAFVAARTLAQRRQILTELNESMARLRGFSTDLATISTDQASSTAEQRAAVEETRRTMDALLESARRIADASQQVFENAERTSKTTTNVSEATRGLVGHAQRIGEISETIRAIADRSDLLALNAALEGTKAGEAGRGFSLVAVEMRRLAENTMGAVRKSSSSSATSASRRPTA